MADREKLIKLLYEPFLQNKINELSDTGDIADHLIANGVTVRERGRWVLGNVEPGYFTPGGNRPWICSQCGEVISYMFGKPTENFCPNCGADMRGEEDG